MITPELRVPDFLTNPVDDLLLFLVGLTLRFFIKTDKVSVKIMLYLLPLILRYIKRYYKSGYMHEELTALEAKIALLKKRFHHGRIDMAG